MIKICQVCGCEFETNNSYRKCCSSKCSHSRIRTPEIKNKISETLKNTYLSNPEKYRRLRKCMVCGKEYYFDRKINTKRMCSKECSNYYRTHKTEFLSKETLQKFSEAGRKSAAKQFEEKRSLNEKYFYELCKNYFKNVKHNEPIFNGWDADILIYDYNIAVLWNGKWHYEQLSKTQSLAAVQNRDKIKLDEIQKLNWIPYIIKDMGKFNKEFVENQFKIFKEYIDTLRVGEMESCGAHNPSLPFESAPATKTRVSTQSILLK